MIIDGVSVTGEGTWFNAYIPFSAEFLAVFENGYLEYKSGKLILNKSEVELEESKVNFGGLNISGDNAIGIIVDTIYKKFILKTPQPQEN